MAEDFYVKNDNSSKRTGAKSNWAWYVGILILALVSISFILPATGFSTGRGGSVLFGKYGKRKIEYAVYPERTLFANVAENYYERYASMFGSASATSQEWIRSMAYSEAFSYVLNRYAKFDLAGKSGLRISDAEAARYLISDYFLDEDGQSYFSEEFWTSLPQETRNSCMNDAKEILAARHFDEDYSKIEDYEANAAFAVDMIGPTRNFNMLAFSGDGAEQRAAEVIGRLNDGESMEDVCEEGQSVIVLDSVSRTYADGSFYPVRTGSGDMGKFYAKLGEDASLPDKLFSMGVKSILPEALELSDGVWAVVEFDHEQNPEQRDTLIGSVRGRMDYLNEGDLDSRLRASSAFEDRFSEGYSKLFASSSDNEQ